MLRLAARRIGLRDCNADVTRASPSAFASPPVCVCCFIQAEARPLTFDVRVVPIRNQSQDGCCIYDPVANGVTNADELGRKVIE